MYIDFHTHAFPDAIAERAVSRLSREGGALPHHTNGTYRDLERAANEADLTYYVVLPIAVKPSQMRTVNDAALAHHGGKVIHFASIHPMASDVFDEIKRIRDLGFKGVKMHPEYQAFFVDDENLFPVYEALSKAELITVFHAGYDLGFFGPAKAAPHRLKKALPFFSGMPVVAAHMGGFADWMNVCEHLIGFPGLYLDTSFSHLHLPPKAATEIIKAHGTSHILFASDSPWADINSEKAYIEALSFSNEEKRRIFYDNAAKLLKLT